MSPLLSNLRKPLLGKSALGVDVVDEGSVPYDPETNGQVEAAVKLLKGQLRVHQLSFER